MTNLALNPESNPDSHLTPTPQSTPAPLIPEPPTIPSHHPWISDLSRDHLIIRDLPPVDHTTLYDSQIMAICLGVKKLYKNGDRAGRQAYREKRRQGVRPENSQVRICVAYTTQLYLDDSGQQTLRISFWPSHTENSNYWLGDHGLRRDLTQAEIDHFAELFAQTCAEELTKHFDEVYYTALHERTEADYFVRRP